MGVLNEFSGKSRVEHARELSRKRAPLEDRMRLIRADFTNWLHSFDGKWLMRDSDFDWMQEVSIDQNILDGFCAELPQYSSQKNFSQSGLYLTALLEQAHNSGFKSMSLTIPHTKQPIHYIGRMLHCDDDPMSIVFNGYGGKMCFADSRYLKVTVNGSLGEQAAAYSHKSEFTLKGAVEDLFAAYAGSCTFFVEGTIGDMFGFHTNRCTFNLPALVPENTGWCAIESRFSSPSLMTLKGISSICNTSSCSFYKQVSNDTFERVNYEKNTKRL